MVKDIIILHFEQINRTTLNELPRSKLRGISLTEFIDLIEASFEEFTRRD